MKIAIDLGGTNMRVALIDEGNIIEKKSVFSPSEQPCEIVLDSIKGLISHFLTPEVTKIGIGVPSVVDADKGIVYNVVNIPSWKEVHLKDELESTFNIPVSVNNDANCFALGIKVFGEGKNTKNLVGVTLGTGVGAGIIINNQLYNGANTCAGEIGSLPYRDYDYEHYCSSVFFTKYHNITARDAALRAINGDYSALSIWEEFGYNLGDLIKMIMLTYDPEMLVFGGGISAAYPFFEKKMFAHLKTFPYPESVKNLKILVSQTPDIALLGASEL
ncbi:ROK family protein [Bacteroides uniformis]|jgi:glucokinase|uniref:ROK family protein n=1 Tax=Bacteroides uniformis TaxID=820 RepID=UPI00319E1D21